MNFSTYLLQTYSFNSNGGPFIQGQQYLSAMYMYYEFTAIAPGKLLHYKPQLDHLNKTGNLQW